MYRDNFIQRGKSYSLLSTGLSLNCLDHETERLWVCVTDSDFVGQPNVNVLTVSLDMQIIGVLMFLNLLIAKLKM